MRLSFKFVLISILFSSVIQIVVSKNKFISSRYYQPFPATDSYTIYIELIDDSIFVKCREYAPITDYTKDYGKYKANGDTIYVEINCLLDYSSNPSNPDTIVEYDMISYPPIQKMIIVGDTLVDITDYTHLRHSFQENFIKDLGDVLNIDTTTEDGKKLLDRYTPRFESSNSIYVRSFN